MPSACLIRPSEMFSWAAVISCWFGVIIGVNKALHGSAYMVSEEQPPCSALRELGVGGAGLAGSGGFAGGLAGGEGDEATMRGIAPGVGEVTGRGDIDACEAVDSQG